MKKKVCLYPCDLVSDSHILEGLEASLYVHPFLHKFLFSSHYLNYSELSLIFPASGLDVSLFGG